jgi:FAD/FMN-containing dehydrogenase
VTTSPALPTTELSEELRSALVDAVGAEHVLVDPALTGSYETDWTGRFTGRACCVVRPAGTEQVAQVLRACSAAGAPIVLQGGNTGLVGGGVPRGGEVVLSLTRLADLEPVDVASGQVTAGAGVRLSALQAHARAAGLDFGVDLAARDSATVGGLLATNAGGIRVLRYGSMREQVLGAEVVLADGTVLTRLSGLPKDNTGYDLVTLLAGSEGTLGVITRVRLKLVPQLPARAVALVAVEGTAAALSLLARLRTTVATLSAAELIFASGVELVRESAGLAAPFAEEYPAYLLVECADRSDPTDELVEALGEAPEVQDATIAGDAAGARALWRYRETHTEAINAAGVPIKLDVAVPVARLPELIDRLPDVIDPAAPAARTIVFGHLNEGNVHVNVLGVLGAPGGDGRAEAVEDAVLRLVGSLGGTISSEHGVGRAKTGWLGLSRTPAEIAAMSSIKRALDPQGLLGPGVLLPG